MAAIDKIYGTNEQYDIFYTWCEKNCKKAIMYFYKRDGYKDNSSRPITNLPEDIDMWLLDNCDIKFVTDYIKEQYDMKE